MSEQPNTRWRGHVNSLAARILEESGYRTDRDFAPVKIQELLANASISYYNVENLLCGLYTEANRWRELIDHKPNYRISAKKLKRRLQTICENAGFLEHPEWLAEITVGDFLEIEGLDEVTIPDLLLELTFTVQEMKDKHPVSLSDPIPQGRLQSRLLDALRPCSQHEGIRLHGKAPEGDQGEPYRGWSLRRQLDQCGLHDALDGLYAEDAG